MTKITKENSQIEKKKKKIDEKKVKKTSNSSETKKKKRLFKRFDENLGKYVGRYVSYTPKQAASKGYTKMLRKLKKLGEKIPKKSTVYLCEHTKGKPKKIYGYVAKRQLLETPQIRKIVVTDKDGELHKKKIKCYYRNKIKKTQVPEEILEMVTKKNTRKSSKEKEEKSSKKTSKKTSNNKNNEKSTKKTKTEQSKPVRKSPKLNAEN
jgi:hypothetical protein